MDGDHILASAAKFLIDGGEEDAASILLSCSLSVWTSGDTWYVGDELHYALKRQSTIGASIDQALEATLPIGFYIKHRDVKAERLDLDPDWRAELLEIARGQGIHNQAVERARLWNGLRFRSQSEIRIAEALDRAGAMFLPNPKARVSGRGGRVNREPDFLICHDGRWAILEVDGEPFHPPSRTVADHERDRLFRTHGVVVVEHFDATRCYEDPDGVAGVPRSHETPSWPQLTTVLGAAGVMNQAGASADRSPNASLRLGTSLEHATYPECKCRQLPGGMLAGVAKFEDSKDGEYALLRTPGRFQVSKHFPKAEQGNPDRFAYQVFDADGLVVFESEDGWATALRTTPTRHQLKALFFESDRHVSNLAIQRFNAQGKPIYDQQTLLLRGEEVKALRDFLTKIELVDLVGTEGVRISAEAARELLAGHELPHELLRERLADIVEFVHSDVSAPDVLALARRQAALEMFEQMLCQELPEPEWQAFFEEEPWILGVAGAPQFLHRVGPNLETVVQGWDQLGGVGKRADALLRTAGALSAFTS